MREPAELLIEPRWLLPMTGSAPALEGQALAVDAGRILAVGPAAELRARYEPVTHLARARHALLPGLVNAHVRTRDALLRALPARAVHERTATAAADFVRDAARLAIAEMLLGGVTCFADLGPHPEELARTAAQAPVRAAVALPVSEGGAGPTAQLERAGRLWDEYRAHPRVSLYFAALAAPTLSDATLTRVRRVADELEARIVLVPGAAAGTWEAQEVGDAASAASSAGALQRCLSLGLVRPGFAAVIREAADLSGAELLAAHGGSLIVCPQASLRTGGVPVPRLPGQRTALGSDSPAEVGALDLWAEARTAALLSGLSAADALQLATAGGATALGLAGEIGTLEAGKSADLVCVELSALTASSHAGVADALLFGTARAQVSEVWCGGRAAVSAQRLLAFDPEELAALPRAWSRRLNLGAAA